MGDPTIRVGAVMGEIEHDVRARLRQHLLKRGGAADYEDEELFAAVRAVLARAVELGGSTLRDFRDAHGAAGEFQLAARVYGRAGEKCLRCEGTVRRIVQGGRASFFCPGCQRR